MIHVEPDTQNLVQGTDHVYFKMYFTSPGYRKDGYVETISPTTAFTRLCEPLEKALNQAERNLKENIYSATANLIVTEYNGDECENLISVYMLAEYENILREAKEILKQTIKQETLIMDKINFVYHYESVHNIKDLAENDNIKTYQALWLEGVKYKRLYEDLKDKLNHLLGIERKEMEEREESRLNGELKLRDIDKSIIEKKGLLIL